MEKVKKILTNTLFVNLVCGLITMGYFILFSNRISYNSNFCIINTTHDICIRK